jgi:predicted transcriptional regulator
LGLSIVLLGAEELALSISDAELLNPAELAAGIVAAFVSHNSLPVAELPGLIEAVDAALRRLATGESVVAVEEKREPAVPIKKSITPDFLICLDDGKKFKSLRRHLTTLGMTPEAYRAKWGLPESYPMVAANYAAQRSELAKQSGLGQARKKGVAPKTRRKPSATA